jgi:hypothetical protein
LKDYHGVGNVSPVEDVRQDWRLITASTNGSHTNLVFSRPVDTLDGFDDVLIEV